jgi:hypothetical protein
MRLTFRSMCTLLAGGSTLAVLATSAGVLATAASATPTPTRTSALPCGFVAQAAPWSFKGQKGTAYGRRRGRSEMLDRTGLGAPAHPRARRIRHDAGARRLALLNHERHHNRPDDERTVHHLDRGDSRVAAKTEAVDAGRKSVLLHLPGGPGSDASEARRL